MKIAIIDGVNQDIGLKILFPSSDYFINNTEIDKCNSMNHYNIIPNTNWSQINDTNYDCLFVVIALYDAYPGTRFYKQNIADILNRVLCIVNNNNFKYVAFFDNYDYDYDPNMIVRNNKINYFFKRNYNKTKKYESNVVPFPFIMFGPTSLIEKCDKELVQTDEYLKQKVERVFFTGGLFIHEDQQYGVVRDRRTIYHKIRSTIYNPGHMHYDNFIHNLRNSKFCLDLLGVGDPNMRTFEILLSGSLILSQYNELKWPFPETFSEETTFKNSEEYFQNLHKLSTDDELYKKCLTNQHNIVKKYFNIEWIRSYILNTLQV
jgi:hypothetical protein